MDNPLIINKTTDLNNSYILIKKYNTKTLFHTESYYGTHGHSRVARDAKIFINKELAEEKCSDLNSNRKKLKYRLESAGKYFINNVLLNFSRSSYPHIKIELIDKIIGLEEAIKIKFK